MSKEREVLNSTTTTVQVPSERLALAAAQGDGNALGELYERHATQIQRFVMLHIRRRQLAEDVAGEVWFRIARSIDRYVSHGDGSFLAWAFSIARNLLRDEHRITCRRPELVVDSLAIAVPAGDPGPADQAVLQDVAERLAKAVRGLSKAQQECVTLRFYQGLTLAETADVLGRSVGGVKQLQLRAVANLRKSLGSPTLAKFLEGEGQAGQVWTLQVGGSSSSGGRRDGEVEQ